MKHRLLAVLTLALLALVPTGVLRAQSIAITVTPALAPNAFGSPSFADWVANAIQAQRFGLSTFGTPGTPSYFSGITNGATILSSSILVTNFNSWLGNANPVATFGLGFANEYGTRLHFSFSAIGSGGLQMSASQLSFSAFTTDPDQALAFDFAAGAYNYGTNLLGVRVGVDGLLGTLDDELITSGPNTQLVDAMYGRGSGNAFEALLGDPGATNQDKADTVAASIVNQAFGGQYTIGAFTGSGGLNIQTVPEPGTWIAGISACLCLGMLEIARRRKKPQLSAA